MTSWKSNSQLSLHVILLENWNPSNVWVVVIISKVSHDTRQTCSILIVFFTFSTLHTQSFSSHFNLIYFNKEKKTTVVFSGIFRNFYSFFASFIRKKELSTYAVKRLLLFGPNTMRCKRHKLPTIWRAKKDHIYENHFPVHIVGKDLKCEVNPPTNWFVHACLSLW